jgi:hypothetical protein
MAGERSLDIRPKGGIYCEWPVSDTPGARERVEASLDEGRARVVVLQPPAEKGMPWEARANGALEGFDDTLPTAVTLVPVVGCEGYETDDADAVEADAMPAEGQPCFALYDQVRHRQPFDRWSLREGVFSYSSAHALMQQAAEGAKGAGIGQPESRERELSASAATQTAATAGAPNVTILLHEALDDGREDGETSTDDTDRATSLGSAFHELAQSMIESGADHSEERLVALSRTWRLSQRQVLRLRRAIGRWERSSLRREALAWPQLQAEAPFFVAVNSRYGTHVEGAIDLLCRDPQRDAALVVDYKTGDVGLSVEEVTERHRMQANFYAWVLMSQGCRAVDCAFCCVEVDAGEGEPLVVRYHFDEDQRPQIG